MAMFRSVRTPPCERCGLPIVEAHYPDGRCPRPPRRSARRRVIRGVAELAGLITFVVAAIVLAGLLRPGPMTSPLMHSGGPVFAGPLRPRLQACELFYRWEATRKTNLLNRAVADAWSPRVPLQWKVRFREDFSGLRSWIRVQRSAGVPYSSSPLAHNYERAIRRDCATSFPNPGGILTRPSTY